MEYIYNEGKKEYIYNENADNGRLVGHGELQFLSKCPPKNIIRNNYTNLHAIPILESTTDRRPRFRILKLTDYALGLEVRYIAVFVNKRMPVDQLIVADQVHSGGKSTYHIFAGNRSLAAASVDTRTFTRTFTLEQHEHACSGTYTVEGTLGTADGATGGDAR